MVKIYTKRALLLICLLFFYANPTISQSYDERLINAYHMVLDLNFRSEIPSLSSDTYQTTNDKAFQIYILNLQNTLDLLLVNDPGKYKSSTSEGKRYNHILNDLDDNDPFVNYLKIELKVHRGLLKIRYGDRISGAFHLIQAFRNIRNFEEKYTGYLYTLKLSGLLNIILSLFPDQYDWILNMFQVDPDFTKGVNYLKELSESNSEYKREGILIYALSQSFYGDNSASAVETLKSYDHLFDKSLLYSYLHGLSSSKNRNNREAIYYFDHCLNFGRSYLQIPAINYHRAESYLKELDYNKASYLYELYLTKPDERQFVKDANYKLYNLSFIYGIPDQGHENYFTRVLTDGSLQTGADKYAYNRITNKYIPDSTLFKSRLLFDGGYFQKSIETLSVGKVSSFTKTEEKCEFYYRYARNYQLQKAFEDAIEYYSKVLEINGSEEFYFWGNAALNLGHIYSETGAYSEAKKYYERALKYKGDSYQNSIRTEAKAGLKKISDH